MRNKPVSERCRGLLWLLGDERGATAVLVAIALPVLFAFGALAINSGFWYTMKRQNQSAADAAALSAAYEVMAGTANATPAATQAATQNGWVNTGTAPAVNVAYSDAIVPSGVEVILHQDQNSLFAYVPAAQASATIATRAVALVNTLGSSCLTALSPSGTGVDVQGSSIINMPNCIITANSNSPSAVHVQGGNNSSLTAATLVTPGGYSLTGSPTFSLQFPAQVGGNPVANPYAPNVGGTCTASPCITHTFLTTGPPAMPTAPCTALPTTSVIGGVTWYTYPGSCKVIQSGSTLSESNIIFQANTQISGGLQIKNQTVNLSPGTYWITDGDLQLGPGGGTSLLECTSCNGTSLGVTIIFTAGPANKIGAVTMQSTSAQIGNLNAPNSGTFAGLLFAQDTVAGATYTSSGTLEGGPSLNFVGTGLVYFPHTDMTFQGNPALGTNGCLVLVANKVSVQGNSTLAATGCTAAGLPGTPTVSTVALAE